MKTIYSNKDSFDDLVGYIGAFKKFSIFKERPNSNKDCGEYIYFEHSEDRDEQHLGLQFILTGLLSVYYDSTRNNISRPGFTAFDSKTKGKRLEKINLKD